MGELIDPVPLKEGIEKKIADLFDLNQKITHVLCKEALDFFQVAGTYAYAARRAYEIAGDIAELAAVSAANTGDLIIAEFGLGDDSDDSSDDDSDRGDEDER